MTAAPELTESDRQHLRRCLGLARVTLDNGDHPFGSVLVDADGVVRCEDHNRFKDGDSARHPEFVIATWAAANPDLGARRARTVYTSGDHCPRCSAVHAWVGLCWIVYAASAEQLVSWHRKWGIPAGGVAPLRPTVAPNVEGAGHVEVAGRDPSPGGGATSLHARLHRIDARWCRASGHRGVPGRSS